jgi:UDP-N-acetylmuramoylalanine--D-glutamate ligase
MLKSAGRKVFLAGNIGTAALSILNKVNKNSLVILELSSFQLQDLDISPHIAAVLDIFPEHQDCHRSLKEYYDAKANIAKHQSADRRTGDKIFFSGAGGIGRLIALKSPARKVPVDEERFNLFKPADLKIPGAHNFKNAVMAAIIAQTLGVPAQIIKRIVKNFRGIPHRLELVRCIRDPNLRIHPNDTNVKPKIRSIRINSDFSDRSICFYDDSASTNPQTTAAAIKAFPSENRVLIAGGQDKGLNYKPLAKALKSASQRIKLVILFGENKNKIKRQIANSGTRVVLCRNLQAAIKIAYLFAKNLPPTTYGSTVLSGSPSKDHLPPTVILFSPGAASFDMFKNYADRGEKFKQIVKKL